ncbi:MAG: hypothetical protein MI747_18325, partial [Desulfobacterales bacterium]|nr:hypothetical protein [Desulfobacterales bacterium]
TDFQRNYASEDQGVEVDLSDQLFTVKEILGSNYADVIYGNDEDNLIIGGGGEDFLSGRAGSDLYLLREDSGEVTIDNSAQDGKLDILRFDFDHDQLEETRQDGDDLIIETAMGTNVRVKDWWAAEESRHLDVMTADGYHYRLDEDGKLVLTSLDFSQYDSGVTADTGDGDRGIIGTAFDDTLGGGDGANHMAPGTGGNDRLTGGESGDVYDLDELEEGRIITINNQAADGQMDTLQLNGWDVDTIGLGKRDNDLWLVADASQLDDEDSLPTTGVKIEDYFVDDDHRHIVFINPEDGREFYVDPETVTTYVWGIDDGARDEDNSRNLASEYKITRIADGPGDDSYIASYGDNLLSSAKGDDHLTGHEGKDTYFLLPGTEDEPRTVTLDNSENQAKDNLLYLEMDRSDLSHSEQQGDNLHILGTGITVVVENWFTDPSVRSLQVATRDGYTWQLNGQGEFKFLSVDLSSGNLGDSYDSTETLLEEIVPQGAISLPSLNPETLTTIRGNGDANILIGNDQDNLIIPNGVAADNTDADNIDQVMGGAGKDQYLISQGDRVIIDNQAEDGLADVVEIDQEFSELTMNRVDDHLVLSGGVWVQIKDFFIAKNNRHISFLTSDGILFDYGVDDLTETDDAPKDVDLIKRILAVDGEYSEGAFTYTLEGLDESGLAQVRTDALALGDMTQETDKGRVQILTQGGTFTLSTGGDLLVASQTGDYVVDTQAGVETGDRILLSVDWTDLNRERESRDLILATEDADFTLRVKGWYDGDDTVRTELVFTDASGETHTLEDPGEVLNAGEETGLTGDLYRYQYLYGGNIGFDFLQDMMETSTPVATFTATDLDFMAISGRLGQSAGSVETFLNDDFASLEGTVDTGRTGMRIQGYIWLEEGDYTFRLAGNDRMTLDIGGQRISLTGYTTASSLSNEKRIFLSSGLHEISFHYYNDRYSNGNNSRADVQYRLAGESDFTDLGVSNPLYQSLEDFSSEWVFVDTGSNRGYYRLRQPDETAGETIADSGETPVDGTGLKGIVVQGLGDDLDDQGLLDALDARLASGEDLLNFDATRVNYEHTSWYSSSVGSLNAFLDHDAVEGTQDFTGSGTGYYFSGYLYMEGGSHSFGITGQDFRLCVGGREVRDSGAFTSDDYPSTQLRTNSITVETGFHFVELFIVDGGDANFPIAFKHRKPGSWYHTGEDATTW